MKVISCLLRSLGSKYALGREMVVSDLRTQLPDQWKKTKRNTAETRNSLVQTLMHADDMSVVWVTQKNQGLAQRFNKITQIRFPSIKHARTILMSAEFEGVEKKFKKSNRKQNREIQAVPAPRCLRLGAVWSFLGDDEMSVLVGIVRRAPESLGKREKIFVRGKCRSEARNNRDFGENVELKHE